MQRIESRFIVFFEEPFWVGVYELISDGFLEACKITFGTEPKDYQVHEYLLNNWLLMQFSPPIKASDTASKKINPKRMQREISKRMEKQGVETKSQQALRQQQEESKIIRKRKSREQREVEKQCQFDLHRQKKKQKHKGH